MSFLVGDKVWAYSRAAGDWLVGNIVEVAEGRWRVKAGAETFWAKPSNPPKVCPYWESDVDLFAYRLALGSAYGAYSRAVDSPLSLGEWVAEHLHGSAEAVEHARHALAWAFRRGYILLTDKVPPA